MSKTNKPLDLRVLEVTKAWEALAPETSFAGLTLTEFKAAVAPSQTVRLELEGITRMRRDAIARRMLADSDSRAVLRKVVNSVRGDPAHGEDSGLYRAMGYKVLSEWKSGLTRGSSNSGSTAESPAPSTASDNGTNPAGNTSEAA
jgi:hypothetical protein